jgi:hypothetical protein
MVPHRRRPSLTPLSLHPRNRSRGTTRIEAIRRIQTVGFDEGWDQLAAAPRRRVFTSLSGAREEQPARAVGVEHLDLVDSFRSPTTPLLRAGPRGAKIRPISATPVALASAAWRLLG